MHGCTVGEGRGDAQETSREATGANARAPAVPLAALATANPFAPLAAVADEPSKHMETLRHVVTACNATGGKRGTASSLQRCDVNDNVRKYMRSWRRRREQLQRGHRRSAPRMDGQLFNRGGTLRSRSGRQCMACLVGPCPHGWTHTDDQMKIASERKLLACLCEPCKASLRSG